MAISSIVGNLIGQSFGTQAAPQGLPDPAAKVANQAESRTEQPLSSTQVKLSAYGRIKGAFAEAQTTGRALADIKKTATADDIKKAATGFVEAFNKANKTVAGADLQRSLAEGNTPGDLNKVGITQNQVGSLTIDEKVFDTALEANPDQVRSVLANAGRQVEQTATRELSDGGNVGASNTLDNRADPSEARQQAQQEQAAAAQRLVETRTAQINNNVVAGNLAAYQRTFTG